MEKDPKQEQSEPPRQLSLPRTMGSKVVLLQLLCYSGVSGRGKLKSERTTRGGDREMPKRRVHLRNCIPGKRQREGCGLRFLG